MLGLLWVGDKLDQRDVQPRQALFTEGSRLTSACSAEAPAATNACGCRASTQETIRYGSLPTQEKVRYPSPKAKSYAKVNAYQVQNTIPEPLRDGIHTRQSCSPQLAAFCIVSVCGESSHSHNCRPSQACLANLAKSILILPLRMPSYISIKPQPIPPECPATVDKGQI